MVLFRHIFFGVIVTLCVLVSSSFVYAEEATVRIDGRLPGTHVESSGPLGIVDNFYQFALTIGGLLAFGAIVYGGIQYAIAAGNSSGQGDAKDRIVQALLGLVLLLSAALILRTINPNIVGMQLSPLSQIEIVKTQPAYGECKAVANGNSPASVANLQSTCFGSNAEKASGIANAESNGDPGLPSGVDLALPSEKSISWGLFQINLTAHKLTLDNGTVLDCPSAFSAMYTKQNHNVNIINNALYESCVAAAKTPSVNIRAACKISNNGQNWGQWGANSKCNYLR